MTWLLPLVAGWSVWLLLDRRLPPDRVVGLVQDHPSGSPSSSRRPTRPSPVAPVRGVRLQRGRWPVGRRSPAALPDLAASVDLLAVAVSAGYSLHGAVRVAGDEGSGPVAGALGKVADDFERGVPLADGLARLPDHLGPGAAPLSTTLSVAAVSGTPVGPALQRLADAERRRSRRAAEARARRLPVLLLGPLVGLVLPAFVVLTIVPAALSSVGRADPPSAPPPPSNSPVAAVAPGP